MEVVVLIASVVLALLFAQAAWHKVVQFQQFQAILADYRVLPAWVVKPAAFLLPLVEAMVAIMWATQSMLQVAAILSMSLLLMYCVAVGVNLYRGRAHISCGCGLGSEQPLSVGIVVRNVLLAVLALAGLVVEPTGVLVWFDYAVIILASLAIGAALAASSVLMSNAARTAGWVKSD